MPRRKASPVDSRDYSTEGSFTMPETGRVIVPESEDIISGEAMLAAGQKDYLAQLAFMEEKVTVVVHESSNINDEPMPMVSVNGRNQFFVRGQDVEVRRKYVEVLARSKPEAISTEVSERNSENPRNRILRKRSHKYPFNVVHDANPKGAAWLKALLQEDQLAHNE
jgi:hypothetical protein